MTLTLTVVKFDPKSQNFRKAPSSDLSHDLIEGSVGRRDRSPAQLSFFRSAQPRESIITDSCRVSPDQAGNPLRPKAFPWLDSGASARAIPYGPKATP
ncbi:hypothetical protein GQ457_15G026150 [Hibiscus cannabinus]